MNVGGHLGKKTGIDAEMSDSNNAGGDVAKSGEKKEKAQNK